MFSGRILASHLENPALISSQCIMVVFVLGFIGGSDSKESTGNVGDMGSTPGLRRSPREGHGNPRQYSSLENPHRQKRLVGCSPWGHKKSDTTEGLSTILHKPPFCSFCLTHKGTHHTQKRYEKCKQNIS